MRTIAIGDIHGCLEALEALLVAIAPASNDTLVPLGDYVDRGPDTRGVLERLIRLENECRLVPLRGNHDQLMLDICDGRRELLTGWLGYGGAATLASYGEPIPAGLEGEPPEVLQRWAESVDLARIPAPHLDFLRRCRLYYEDERHIFVHASYEPKLPLAEQSPRVLLWESLKTRLPGPHCSGKLAVLGHTSQQSGEILELGYARCIDTRCYGQGWLTAMDLSNGQVWQADKYGRLRLP